MDETPTIAAAREFLALVLDVDHVSDEALAAGLDRLACAYQAAPEGALAEDDQEPPDRDYDVAYQTIGRRFPDYGYYSVVDPVPVPPDEAMIGDAIDDLADIVGELKEVCWRFETFGPDDAHWWFRHNYRTHWGRHLRDLALYVHARQFG
jgi:hypothetical protein